MRTKPLFLALALALLSPLCVHAQGFSKGTLSSQINQQFPDQNSGAITPATTRGFLNNIVNSFQQFAGVNPQVGTSYTIQASDYGQLVTFNNASAVAVTLPQTIAGSFTFYPFSFYVENFGTGTATIAPQGGSLINGASSFPLPQGQSAFIISDGTNYQVTAAANATVPNGKITLQRVTNPSFEVSTWAAYNQNGVSICNTATSSTTTGCLLEANKAAFPYILNAAPAGYDMEVIGGMDPAPTNLGFLSGGAVVIPMSTGWTTQPMQGGKIIAHGISLACTVTIDSVEFGQIDFQGSQIGACAAADARNAIVINPTHGSPLDHIIAVGPSQLFFQSTNGGLKITGGMMQSSNLHVAEVNAGSAPTPLTSGAIVSVDTASTTSLIHNHIQLDFVHGLNTAGMTAIQDGSAPESGGFHNAYNDWHVGLAPDSGSPAVNGVITYGHNNWWWITIDNFTGANFVIEFQSGACGNEVHLQGAMPTTPFIDNGGCGANNKNSVWVNGVLVTGGVIATDLPTITGSGQGAIGASTAGGLTLFGWGTSDLTLANRNGTGVCSIAGLATTLACSNLSLATALPVSSGGTGGATASGSRLDAITGFSSTGFINRTGAGAYSFTGSTGSGNVVQATGPTMAAPTVTGLATFSGQIVSATGAPTIASGACGTGANGTVTGTNQSGIITIGSAATTSCAVSFSATLASAPSSCVIAPGNAAAGAAGTTVARVGTPTTGGFTVTGSALANTVYSYFCL